MRRRQSGRPRCARRRSTADASRTDGTSTSLDPCRTVQVVAAGPCVPAGREAVAATAAPERWRRDARRRTGGGAVPGRGGMRARRFELAALEVLEAGKPWREADADVCEAIDFCEYYGREMLPLDAGGTASRRPARATVSPTSRAASPR